jgi:asparagine synthetase B (glutamine-hydrolysing)
MCNINLVYNLNKERLSDDEISLLNVITYLSFQRNNHGEGFFTLDADLNVGLGKSPDKIIFRRDNIKDAYFVATHQRLATSGCNNIMIHPHEVGRFVLLHNGVFWGLSDKEKSDTRIYTETLNQNFNTLQDLKKAINKTNSEVQGSFSIVLYDRVTGKVYYFKNSSTSAYLLRTKNLIIISTDENNLTYAKRFFNLKAKITPIKNLRLFDVLDEFKSLGKIDNTKSLVSYGKCDWEDDELPQKKTKDSRIWDYDPYFGYVNKQERDNSFWGDYLR